MALWQSMALTLDSMAAKNAIYILLDFILLQFTDQWHKQHIAEISTVFLFYFKIFSIKYFRNGHVAIR